MIGNATTAIDEMTPPDLAFLRRHENGGRTQPYPSSVKMITSTSASFISLYESVPLVP